MKTDSQIKTDVEAELQWTPEVDESGIAIKVAEGVVTLIGFVESYAEKHAAVVAAKRVIGVAGVADEIEVRLSPKQAASDPDIAREAVAALRADLPFVHDRIKVVVDNAVITLDGRLDWAYQRDSAVSAVRNLRGVKGVANLLTVQPRVVPAEVRRKIQSAFMRNAQLDANRISIEAKDGEVVLRGTLNSWAEVEEAQRTAWSAPGVSHVRSELKVGAAR
jgi:osmotically-inducible protein OsmY